MYSTACQERKIIIAYLHTILSYFHMSILWIPWCKNRVLQQDSKFHMYMGNTKNSHSRPPPPHPLLLWRGFEGKGFLLTVLHPPQCSV